MLLTNKNNLSISSDSNELKKSQMRCSSAYKYEYVIQNNANAVDQ